MVVKGESSNIQNGIMRFTHVNGSWFSERTSLQGKSVGLNRTINANAIALHFNYKDKEKNPPAYMEWDLDGKLMNADDPEELFGTIRLHKLANGKFTFIEGEADFIERTEGDEKQEEEPEKPPTE
jgi:hypothetical protein